LPERRDVEILARKNLSKTISLEDGPSLLTLVLGEKREIPTNYPNMDIIFQSEYENLDNPSDFLNNFLYETLYEAVLFIGKGQTATDENSIKRMVKGLFEIKNSVFTFSDTLAVNDNQETLYVQRNSILDNLSNQVVNTPFICKMECMPKFNREIQDLVLYYGFNELKKTHKECGTHIAESLFKNNWKNDHITASSMKDHEIIKAESNGS